jgi:hypothetical protein
MAGFEVVVRPVVFPNIRPAPAQSLPPADDPEKGVCTIHGNPATQVDFTVSWSSSQSKSHNVETERRVDEVRVYQEEDDGTVNRDNFVDIQVANRIKSRGGKKPAVDGSGPGFGTPGVGGPEASEQRIDYYRKVEEAKNIEIQERDKIKKAE